MPTQGTDNGHQPVGHHDIRTRILGMAVLTFIAMMPGGGGGSTHVSGPRREAPFSQLPADVTVWRFDGASKQWQAIFAGDLTSVSQLPPRLAPGEAIYVRTDEPIELALPPSSDLRITYYHEDHLGSSSVVTDAAGAVVEETAYYSFGATRHEQRLRQVETHYEFTQKERDGESGLHYFESRYMASRLSRFASVDRKYLHPERLATNELGSVLANPQRLNAYAYVMNNPARWIDRDGFAPGDPFKTPQEAATDALIAANPKSMTENREYGGKVYYDSFSKRYYATVPAPGKEAAFNPGAVTVPAGTTTIGDYHTHADYTWLFQTPMGTVPIHPVPQTFDSYASDRFSNADLTGITADATGVAGYKGYLGTPGGKFHQFDPATATVSDLSSAQPVKSPPVCKIIMEAWWAKEVRCE